MGIKRERRTVRIVPALVSATLLGGGVLVGPSVAQAATGTGTAADATGISTITTASSPNLALDSVEQVDCPQHLTPNWTYRSIWTYHTDFQGRPEWGRARMLSEGNSRRSKCEGIVGRMGGPGYQGGHLIAASLRGVSRRFNLVPMTVRVNLGAMAVMENAAKRCLRRRGGVVRDYTTTVEYYNIWTLVPDHIAVSFLTNTGRGMQIIEQNFPNADLSKSYLTRLRNDVRTETDAAGCKPDRPLPG